MTRTAQEPVRKPGAAAEVVAVSSPEQLTVIAGMRLLRPFMPATRLLLRMPSVQASLQQVTERRLNFWLGVCGCKVGGLLFLAALAWQIGGSSRAHASIVEAVLPTVAWAVAAGVVGKGAAVFIARAIFLAEIALFRHRSATVYENGSASHGMQRDRSVDH